MFILCNFVMCVQLFNNIIFSLQKVLKGAEIFFTQYLITRRIKENAILTLSLQL